jgi:hypothetical protein
MQHHRPSAGNVELGGANRQARLSRCRSPQQSARHWALLLVVLMITALVLPTPRRANGLARDLARPVSNGSAVSSAQALAQASSAPLALSPTFLLNGQIGTPYLQAMSASGGTAPYTFAITYGDLPPGLAFSPDGVLSGTPTMAGEYGFSMTANDAHGATGSQFYGLTIISPIAISPPLLPEGKAGTAYRQSFASHPIPLRLPPVRFHPALRSAQPVCSTAHLLPTVIIASPLARPTHTALPVAIVTACTSVCHLQ